jgi:hypothetical protein
MSEMHDKMQAYEDEVKRMRNTYGPDAEIPRNPYGNLTPNHPIGAPLNARPVTERIAELGKRVAEASRMLSDARGTQRDAAEHLHKCELSFAQLADELTKALHEHREGTPEGVPYPR